MDDAIKKSKLPDDDMEICKHMLRLKGFSEILQYIGMESGVSLDQIIKFAASKKLAKDEQHSKIIVHALKNMKLADSAKDNTGFHLIGLGKKIFDDGIGPA